MILTEKPGTVLLFKKENTEGIYTFLLSQTSKFADSITKGNLFARFIVEQISKYIVDYLAEKTGHKYIHTELVLNNGWTIASWFNGVHIYELSDAELVKMRKIVDVYVPKVDIDANKLKQVAKKYWKKQYDFASLIQNAIIELLAFGNEQTEKEIEEKLKKYFDTPDRLICSELVARIYSDLGYTIERHSEFTTPDDISQSELFQRVYF